MITNYIPENSVFKTELNIFVTVVLQKKYIFVKD